MATYETQIENLIGEDINSSSTDVLQIDVTNWMAEGLQTIVNVLPSFLKFEIDCIAYVKKTRKQAVTES